MLPVDVILYTQNFAKIVTIELSKQIIQIELHIYYEEYYDYFADLLSSLQNKIVRFKSDNLEAYNSIFLNKQFVINDLMLEKKPESSLLLGDSWLNIVVNCVLVEADGTIPDINVLEMFQTHLKRFDEIFGYVPTGEFTINTNTHELNILLNSVIKKIKLSSGEILINEKIKSLVIKDE